MIDWTFALLFRPDIVKISLDSEVALVLREAAEAKVPETGAGSPTAPAALPACESSEQAASPPRPQERA
jgi:hypothetical protein